jgi:hypothetical protein
MSPLEAYQLYVSVKNHFTLEKYDHFLYRGKAGQRQEQLDRRPDKKFFKWLGELESPVDVLVAAFSRSDKVYVKDILENQERYAKIVEEHTRRVSGLLYWYEQDLRAVPDLWGAMRSEGGRRPRALQLMSSCDLHPVTSSALDACSECLESWSRTVVDPVTLPGLKLRMRKLRGFIGLRDESTVDELRRKLFEIVEGQ